MPLVSVIVPNYNHAPYLRQRLDSIFNQTFQDFEVIILDDCSTDNSKEIIEEYRNRPQVSHVVYNETNSGSPFKQWAKGFDLAQGEYIWIAESDDWAELNFLEEMLPILNNDASLSFAYCNSFMEDGRKDPLTRNTFDKTIKISCSDMLRKYLCWGCWVYNASSVIFHKKNLLKIPCDYQTYSSSGDYLFWIYQSELGNVYYNFKALNHYRIHQANTSTIKDESGDACVEDFNIYLYLKKKGYYSFFERHAFILERLEKLHSKLQFISNKKIYNLYLSYRNEIFSIKLSKLLIKTGTLIWNLKKRMTSDKSFRCSSRL